MWGGGGGGGGGGGECKRSTGARAGSSLPGYPTANAKKLNR